MSWFYVIGLSFDKMHFTCIWVDLGCFKYFKKSCFKIKYWTFQVCSKKQVQSAKSLKLDSWSTAASIELKEAVFHSMCSTPAWQLIDTCYLSRFKIFKISIGFSWDLWMCLWAFFSPKPRHIKGFFLRAGKEFTSCTSIEQSLFKQIVIGEKVLP